MAHLVETMFSLKQVPWHGLGNIVHDALTTHEAIVQAGLDWEVKVQPVFTPEFTPMTMENPLGGDPIVGVGSFGAVLTEPYDATTTFMEKVDLGGVVRRTTDGQMMGLVGPRWTPVQNRDAFRFFDPMVESGMAILHTAGSLNGGRTVWILAQIGNELAIAGNDRVAQFLLLSMGHDGVRGIRVQPTPIRVVCANTLSMATASERDTSYLITHTSKAGERLDELQTFIQPHLASFEKTTELFRDLAHKPFNTVVVEQYLKTLFPDPEDGTRGWANQKARELIETLFAGEQIGDGEMPNTARRSGWSMYSAVTEYIDHHSGRTPQTRTNSAWFGSGSQLKKQALALAMTI